MNFNLRIRKVLLIASGSSVSKEYGKIRDFIKNDDPVIISINHVTPINVKVNYYFFSNQKRYNEFANKLNDGDKVIISSNIMIIEKHNNCYVCDYVKLKKIIAGDNDNSTLLFIAQLVIKSVDSVYLAGIDGYKSNMLDNYSYEEYDRVSEYNILKEENLCIRRALIDFVNKISIHFITDSIFKDILPLRIVGIIPARYKSSRFEGKPLALIDGVPMIKRTYDQTRKCNTLNKTIVATDDMRILNYCKKNEINVMLTSNKCLTGTDRIAELAKSNDYDFYINIQGDEPVISPDIIDTLINEYKKYGNKYIAYNFFKKITDKNEVSSRYNY